ncbi:MAG: class I SAM-dependent methyltransferase [Lachnospiraceae bacterium]|nr:class I SAM-dependent methyltransferase [Lachnospiraceae bacterium]
MQEYTGFAAEYDKFMDNVPYDEWVKYICMLLKENGVADKSGKLVCELGCGTGSVTRRLKDRGYDMIGIDISEEMLEIARYDYFEESEGILYLLQDMREFELYGTVDAFVSVCDSMNYLLTEKDLLKTFKLVNNYLEAGGVFIFDMKTEYEYMHAMGTRTIAETREDAAMIWENSYDEKLGINTYDITIFSLVDDEEEIYQRFEEQHKQKSWPIDKVKELIEKAGMEFVCVYDAFTKNVPNDTSERVYFVAREKKQKGKLYV